MACQYAKPVTLYVEECDRLLLSALPVWQRFSVCRGVCVRAGAKNDARNIREASGISSACRTVAVT